MISSTSISTATRQYLRRRIVQAEAPHVLAKWGFTVNESKTERYTLQHGATCEIKKLGCYIDQGKDLEHHANKIKRAFGKMWRLWFRDHIVSEKMRLRLYEAYIMPLFRYNLGALGVSDTDIKALDVLHRKQLRHLLRIHYPNRIGNIDLYKRCGAEPISAIAKRQRWRLFGHILRLPEAAPAKDSMKLYFRIQDDKRYKGGRGRQKTTLPLLLKTDLAKLDIRLHSRADFDKIQDTARDRDSWKQLTHRVMTAQPRPRSEKKEKRKQQEAQDKERGQVGPEPTSGAAKKTKR